MKLLQKKGAPSRKVRDQNSLLLRQLEESRRRRGAAGKHSAQAKRDSAAQRLSGRGDPPHPGRPAGVAAAHGGAHVFHAAPTEDSGGCRAGGARGRLRPARRHAHLEELSER